MRGKRTLRLVRMLITNLTSGHESNAGVHPSRRLEYPDQHIEVDNRLVWFLARLAARYPDARFIHLRRDPEAVAQSLLRRWELYPRAPQIVKAWAHGVYLRKEPWDEVERLDLCRDFVATVEATISAFLVGRRPHVVDIEDVDLAGTWAWLGAEGDLAAAKAELAVRHNA